MALKMTKRTKLPVKVNGSITGEDGLPVSFAFTLLCKRYTQAQLDQVHKNDALVRDFLTDVVEGWESVNDSENNPLEFNSENMGELFQEAGMRGVCFNAYMRDVSAVAKV